MSMSEKEFRRLAEAYGGDLSRWPEARRSEAAELARGSERLAALLAAESAFDARLRSTAPFVATHRAEAVMRAAMGAVAALDRSPPPAFDWGRRRVGLGLLGCALLGFALGFWTPPAQSRAPKPQDVIRAVINGGTPTFF